MTARDLQKKDNQWARAKGSDSFCPLGPWIETELDPSDLLITTRVNGEVKQEDRSSLMIFDIPAVIAYVTSFMTLLAGRRDRHRHAEGSCRRAARRRDRDHR